MHTVCEDFLNRQTSLNFTVVLLIVFFFWKQKIYMAGCLEHETHVYVRAHSSFKNRYTRNCPQCGTRPATPLHRASYCFYCKNWHFFLCVVFFYSIFFGRGTGNFDCDWVKKVRMVKWELVTVTSARHVLIWWSPHLYIVGWVVGWFIMIQSDYIAI